MYGAQAPPWVIARLRSLMLLFLLFGCFYLVVGDDGAPGGSLFALLAIFVAASCGGTLAGALGLPPLLGMLCVGVALRNLPFVGERVGGKVDPRWSSAIRLLALTLILCRAGLAFDVAALRRLRFVVVRLAVLPCLTETLVIAGLSSVLLEFPLSWALMLGFVVSAISPAVVVPSLLSLQERGYGTATGIPTLVVAAAPLDDVLAIAGFGICLNFSMTGSAGASPLWLDIVRAPLELVLGVGTGMLGAAVLLVLLPAAPPSNVATIPPGGALGSGKEKPISVADRVVMLFGLAVASAFALKRAKFSGASALSVLTLAVSSAHGWGPSATKPMAVVLADVWNRFAQPLLFGLVGSTVVVEALQPRLVGLGLVMLVCSVTVRCGVAYLAVGWRGLRWQERLFTALAWMPKATVQAAIGAIALDEASNDREVEMGRDILAIAVLSIICTAPLGAIAISFCGPRLLVLDKCVAVEANQEQQPPQQRQEGDEEAAKHEDDVGEAGSQDCPDNSSNAKDSSCHRNGVAAPPARRDPAAGSKILSCCGSWFSIGADPVAVSGPYHT